MTLAIALLLEWLLGDPRTRWHPVALFGAAAGRIEACLYADRRSAGVLAWALAVLPVVAAWHLVLLGLRHLGSIQGAWLEAGLGGVAIWATLGWRSLLEHVAAVQRGSTLEARRCQLARIVGRDVAELSDSELRGAALESLAENASDAVVAPLFWAALAGPEGALAYRWINTLDAMWGHRGPRYGRFGWAAARADDLASFVPARLTAALYLSVSLRRPSRRLVEQARAHPSPNAGWPESALAQVLGVRLGGPVKRSGRTEQRPWMGPEDAPAPSAGAFADALRLTRRTLVAACLCGVLAWL